MGAKAPTCACLRDQALRGHEVEARLSVKDDPPFEKHTFNSGATYAGEWLGMMRHGHGTQEWPDGARYVGQWVNDKTWGRGRFEHAGGSSYDGQWYDDKQHGHGLESWPDGAWFE